MVAAIRQLGSTTTRVIGDLGAMGLFLLEVARDAVTPRAVGMVLVMPLLTALFIVCGIFGGWLVGVKLLGVDSGTYFTSLESSVDLRDDLSGSLLKAGVFGVLVGWIATYRGYTSAPTSAGVSAATTATVVVASVSVLIFDYLITALWGV